jgi:hypothetical protein
MYMVREKQMTIDNKTKIERLKVTLALCEIALEEGWDVMSEQIKRMKAEMKVLVGKKTKRKNS